LSQITEIGLRQARGARLSPLRAPALGSVLANAAVLRGDGTEVQKLPRQPWVGTREGGVVERKPDGSLGASSAIRHLEVWNSRAQLAAEIRPELEVRQPVSSFDNAPEFRVGRRDDRYEVVLIGAQA
jgi:hypothetical protein